MQAVNSRGQAVSLLQDDSRTQHRQYSTEYEYGRRSVTGHSDSARHLSERRHTEESWSQRLQAPESGASWLASHPSHHHHQQRQQQDKQQQQQRHHHLLLRGDSSNRQSSSLTTHSSSFPSLSTSASSNNTSATSASASPSSTSNSPSLSNTTTHTTASTSSLSRPQLTSPSSSSPSLSHLHPTASKVAALEPPVANSTLRPHRDRVPPLQSLISSSSTSLPYHHSAHTSSSASAQKLRRPTLYHQSAYASDSRKSSYSSSISHTDASSCTSPSESFDSPCFSPGAVSTASTALPTPQLLRNESASTNSSSSRSLNTPSPMSHAYSLDPLDQSKQVAGMPIGVIPPSGLDPYSRHMPGAHPYFAAGPQHPMAIQDPSASFFPLQQGGAPLSLDAAAGFAPMPPSASVPIMPYATDLIQPSPQFQPGSVATNSASPPNADQSSVSSNGANGQPTKARKKYPCPHAARFGCTDTFTTSGHAARHGKKHTGEKNIHCPTCHKAFTRKDNMKQHERTHRNNRDSVGSATDTSSKRGKSNHHASTSVTNASVATVDSTPNSALPVEMDMDGIAFGGRAPMDFNAVHGVPAHNSVFLDHDLETGGPSPGNDELRYGVLPDLAMPPMKRPAGVKREISQGGTSQDGEGESPGLDALAMAASGFT